MLSSLLPYTANITRPIIINSWWEDYKSYETIYSSIKCRYYYNKQNLRNTNIWSETPLDNLNVIIDSANTNVKVWDEIEILDNTLSSIWTYLISDVKAQRLFNSINHIELKIWKI